MSDYGEIYGKAGDHAMNKDCPSCGSSGSMKKDEYGDITCKSCGFSCERDGLQSQWIEKLLMEDAGIEDYE